VSRSYERINYSLRPAKQIERKMIFEACKRLESYALLPAYRYVGFGSIFFSDFSLVHRQLNISKMVSIEKDEKNKERFEFNRPFKCIDLQFGKSSTVLPTLDWSDRTILWLDYDGPLDASVIADVESFCVSASSGSVLIVTVNAIPPLAPLPNKSPIGSDNEDDLGSIATKDTQFDFLRERLSEDVGKNHVPHDTERSDFAGWNYAALMRRIIHSTVEDAIRRRNRELNGYAILNWNPTFSFDYSDGCNMTTFGGVLSSKGEQKHYESGSFSDFDFYQSSCDKSFRIKVPILTAKELRVLDSMLPDFDNEGVSGDGIRSADIAAYAKIYRYFPNFAEIDR